MSKICSNCNAENINEAKFCRKCGKRDFSNTNAKNHLEINEDAIYEQVMLEIEEDRKVKSAWARALAESDGDANRLESLYIQFRVKTIKAKVEAEKNLIDDDEEEVEKTYTKLDVFFYPDNYTEEEKKRILGDEYGEE